MIGKFKYVVISDNNPPAIIWEKTKEAAGKVAEAKFSGITIKEILTNKEYLVSIKPVKIRKKRTTKVKPTVVTPTNEVVSVVDSSLL